MGDNIFGRNNAEIKILCKKDLKKQLNAYLVENNVDVKQDFLRCMVKIIINTDYEVLQRLVKEHSKFEAHLGYLYAVKK